VAYGHRNGADGKMQDDGPEIVENAKPDNTPSAEELELQALARRQGRSEKAAVKHYLNMQHRGSSAKGKTYAGSLTDSCGGSTAGSPKKPWDDSMTARLYSGSRGGKLGSGLDSAREHTSRSNVRRALCQDLAALKISSGMGGCHRCHNVSFGLDEDGIPRNQPIKTITTKFLPRRCGDSVLLTYYEPPKSNGKPRVPFI
jgi:hypothetical protein